MASWNFRKRITIIPGVRLNLSKSGVSTTIGMRGANVNLGKKGAYLNVGIPGTGLYKRERIDSGIKEVNESSEEQEVSDDIAKADNIFSEEPAKITSQNMEGVKESIILAHKQRIQLQNDIEQVKKTLSFSKFKLIACYLLIFGFIAKNLVKELKGNIQKQKSTIADLVEQKDASFV